VVSKGREDERREGEDAGSHVRVNPHLDFVLEQLVRLEGRLHQSLCVEKK